MTPENLDGLYGEVVEQLQTHLHRGESTSMAQTLHAEFCGQMIQAVPSMTEISEFFLKDIAIAFADCVRFKDRKAPALKALKKGTSAGQIAGIKPLMQMRQSAQAAWTHIVTKDEEAAATIIAIVYRLHAESKFEKLLALEEELEASHAKSTQLNTETNQP